MREKRDKQDAQALIPSVSPFSPVPPVSRISCGYPAGWAVIWPVEEQSVHHKAFC
jgi:hypothetical protein